MYACVLPPRPKTGGTRLTTAEQLETGLMQLFNAEAEGQVADASLTYTELLLQPWPGISIMGAQLDPSYTGALQPVGLPLGALGSGNGTPFSVAQLVQQMLAPGQLPT
jgi:hypothetical protein